MERGETQLMKRYCDGDVAAFRELYALVAPRLLAYLRGLVGERAAAEDLLQQTFLKLHEARSAYLRDADSIPWIFTVARRSALDELRRRTRARVQLPRGEGGPPEGRADLLGRGEEEGAEAVAPAGAAALAALDRLPPAQREALV